MGGNASVAKLSACGCLVHVLEGDFDVGALANGDGDAHRESASRLALVCRDAADFFRRETTKHRLCRLVALRRGIHFIPSTSADWREQYIDWNGLLQHFAKRIAPLVLNTAVAQEDEECKIRVCVRVRPDFVRARPAPVGQNGSFQLPFHQKINFLRAQDGISRKEALKKLVDGGEWFGPSCEEKENVRDEAEGFVSKIESIDKTGIVMMARGVGMRPFKFDRVFSPSARQRDVYMGVGGIVSDFLNGTSSAILTYGQTGSGKTFTMFGESCKSRGVVPQACLDVIECIEYRRKLGHECALSASYVEIYGKEINDLLTGGTPVGHSRVAAGAFVLSGHAQVNIAGMKDIESLLERGAAQKRVSATQMNRYSTRAHSIFILKMKWRAGHDNAWIESSLCMADLGGSERVKRSKIETGRSVRGHGWVAHDRFREAVQINRDLLSLKKTIEALNKKDQYVPYKDSKLTSMLAGCLTSRVAIIVCASKSISDAAETLESLRFAEQVSSIKNRIAGANFVERDLIRTLDAKIDSLTAVIKAKETWESKIVEREDIDGTETVRVSYLVGAERERERLEELVRARAKLTGDDADLKLASVGFGGKYGGSASALGGNAASRFGQDDIGLSIKGKKTAKWVS